VQPQSDWTCEELSSDQEELEQLRLELFENENDVRVLLRMGDLHLRLEEHDRALSLYERVAEIYASEGRLIKAVAVFKQMHRLIDRRAPHLAERFAYTQGRLAELFEQLGLRDDALAIYKSMAMRHVEAGREHEARAMLLRVIALAPDSITARMMLSTLEARAGDIDSAVRTLEQVVTLSLASGRKDEAVRALRRALKLQTSVDKARLLAELLLERDGHEDAMEALQHLSVCYRANPKSIPTLRFLVRAFDRVGQPEKANAVLKESARIVFDSGARETFNRIVNALLHRAPNDPEVAELDAMHEPVLLKSVAGDESR
jgi:tetratricopeptide (TPR) repeat protein